LEASPGDWNSFMEDQTQAIAVFTENLTFFGHPHLDSDSLKGLNLDHKKSVFTSPQQSTV
jgi:hypothetical protein